MSPYMYLGVVVVEDIAGAAMLGLAQAALLATAVLSSTVSEPKMVVWLKPGWSASHLFFHHSRAELALPPPGAKQCSFE